MTCPNRSAVWPIRELFECLHRRCNNVIQPRYRDWGEDPIWQTHSGYSEHALPCSKGSLFKDFVPQVRCWYVRREGEPTGLSVRPEAPIGCRAPSALRSRRLRGTEWDDHTNRLP
jgi:hypothetical protein